MSEKWICKEQNAFALDTVLDLVSCFSIFKDDFVRGEFARFQSQIDKHFKGNKDVEVLHTGSGYEKLFLPHIDGHTLNADGDHMLILNIFSVIEDICGQPNTNAASVEDLGQVLYMCNGSHAGYVLLSKIASSRDVQHCLQTSEFIKDSHGKYGKMKSVSSNSKITGPSQYSVVNAASRLNIERDFVYSLKCKQWPSQAIEWKNRIRKSNWPTAEMICFIVSSGCHLVPVSSHESDFGDFEWRLSFSWAELQLIDALPEQIKISYAILKTLIKIEMKKHCVEMFASYHLKTTLLFLLEEETSINEFREMKISQVVLSLLGRFLLFYKSFNMPNYFVRTNNMIDHRSSDEIENAVQVLEYIKTNLTHILCEYIDAYQSPPISFDMSFAHALQSDDMKELNLLCKYNFVLFALAKFLLTSKEEVLVRLEDDSAKTWCVNNLAKAKYLHNLTMDHQSSQQSNKSNLDSIELDSTAVLKLLDTFVKDDKLGKRNTCVLFATFNVFLTTIPSMLELGKDKETIKKVSLFLGNASFFDLFVWILNFSDDKCGVLHDFVTNVWTDKPNFIASDSMSEQLSRLLVVTLAKATNQSKLVNGTLIRNLGKDFAVLMIRLYEYLLVNNMYSSAFVAIQVRAYESNKDLLWWVNFFIGNTCTPNKVIKQAVLKMVMSEEYFEDKLSLEIKNSYNDMILQLSN